MITVKDDYERHPTFYTLLGRKQIEVNTDPQRRYYNGCHASSKMVWTEWYDLGYPKSKEDGEISIALYKSINPGREYKLIPPKNGAV